MSILLFAGIMFFLFAHFSCGMLFPINVATDQDANRF
jgi:hypothetical protein